VNTEPPTGDELTQMLVTMKHHVLTEVRPRGAVRRHRIARAGIVVGVVAVLGIGAGTGAVALGLVPAPFTPVAEPTAAVTPTPSGGSGPSSAPVTPSFRPSPSATPEPTSTRAPFALDDPSTWTISGSEVGPVALGGRTDQETDELDAALIRVPSGGCTPEGVWRDTDGLEVQVVSSDAGNVASVVVSWPADRELSGPVPGPTTALGIGVGSTLDELHAAYPGLRNDSPGFEGAWSMWSADTADGPVRFQVGPGTRLVNVWVGGDGNLPTAICDL
jgi:hypothetical protein